MEDKNNKTLKDQQKIKGTRDVVETAIQLSKTKKGSWKTKRGEFKKASSYTPNIKNLSF